MFVNALCDKYVNVPECRPKITNSTRVLQSRDIRVSRAYIPGPRGSIYQQAWTGVHVFVLHYLYLTTAHENILGCGPQL